jgi:hypothetical protein
VRESAEADFVPLVAAISIAGLRLVPLYSRDFDRRGGRSRLTFSGSWESSYKGIGLIEMKRPLAPEANAMRKPVKNRHQKAAFKVGERRLAPQEIPELLELSLSSDPEDRLHAASNLCPCHVRRKVDDVWQALYRMMEDEDVRVRRAAWHTLEDGGRPDDPALDDLIERTLQTETDKTVRNFAALFAGQKRAMEDTRLNALAQAAPKRRGRCDFCGEFDVFVELDLETMIPTEDLPRAALVCEACRG